MNVFKSFRKLSRIWFDPTNLIDVIRNQGIEWVRAINSDLNVDVTNAADLSNYKYRLVLIVLNRNDELILNEQKKFAYDHDFCLFVNFPFNQMIAIVEEIYMNKYKNNSHTCTEIWLFRN